MARFYVEKDGEWNIFSTVVDDFILDEFVCLDALKARLLYERYMELTKDIDSLLTDRPKVNVMSYAEAMERVRKDEPRIAGKHADHIVIDEPQAERHLPDYSYEADLGRRIMERMDVVKNNCTNCEYSKEKYRIIRFPDGTALLSDSCGKGRFGNLSDINYCDEWTERSPE